MGKELKNHEIVIQVTPEGFVISLKELGFFNSGQATLLPGAAEKLKRIAKVLAARAGVRVEGHSDNQPIHNDQFGSNWELSTARAMSVLLLLVNDAQASIPQESPRPDTGNIARSPTTRPPKAAE